MPSFSTKELFYYPTSFLYEIVTDVAQYPSFLPWCLGAQILEKNDDMLIADLTVGAGPFKDTFRSRVLLTPFSKVEVLYEKGPLKHLRNIWEFNEVANDTQVFFEVDFSFQNPFLNKIMESAFPKASQKMMEAFKKRAEKLYPHKKLHNL